MGKKAGIRRVWDEYCIKNVCFDGVGRRILIGVWGYISIARR